MIGTGARARPIRVFLDRESIRPGDEWHFTMFDALQHSTCMVCILSATLGASEYTAEEFMFAKGRMPIIPIHDRPLEAEQVGSVFRVLHWQDLSPARWADNFPKLVTQIRRCISDTERIETDRASHTPPAATNRKTLAELWLVVSPSVGVVVAKDGLKHVFGCAWPLEGRWLMCSPRVGSEVDNAAKAGEQLEFIWRRPHTGVESARVIRAGPLSNEAEGVWRISCHPRGRLPKPLDVAKSRPPLPAIFGAFGGTVGIRGLWAPEPCELRVNVWEQEETTISSANTPLSGSPLWDRDGCVVGCFEVDLERGWRAIPFHNVDL